MTVKAFLTHYYFWNKAISMERQLRQKYDHKNVAIFISRTNLNHRLKFDFMIEVKIDLRNSICRWNFRNWDIQKWILILKFEGMAKIRSRSRSRSFSLKPGVGAGVTIGISAYNQG